MSQSSYQPVTQLSLFPPVIKNLLIINGLFFLAQAVPATDWTLTQWLALWPLGSGGPTPLQGSTEMVNLVGFWPWQLVTYGFLHGDLMHLLFNMFGLWMFGTQIENTWGSRRFALFYFVCVVGAGFIQLLVASSSGTIYPTVGASGGVFGILLAFGMMFPNQPIYLYFLFPIKAKWLVIGFGVLELWNGITATASGIAHFAHLGGMLFGLLLILYWRGKLPVKPKRPVYF
ncbi:MAG: rhomboid family intramembrane serine protease [Bacteroidota bacterium]